jgi:hypothetical protein
MSTDTFMDLLQEELSAEADPRFAAEMDEWVAAGFPRRQPRRRAGWLDRAARAVRTPVGMATASMAVAGLVIALLVIGDSTQQTTSGRDFGTSAAGDATTSEQLAPSPPPSLPEPAPREAAPSAGAAAPSEPNRRVERQSEITLAAPGDEFQSVGDKILRITDSHNGFVLRSSVSTGDNPSGDFQLRVPGDELQGTLKDLSALGDVKARNDMGQDVTAQYVSATDSLAAARADRRGLLRRLAAANDDAHAQRLRDRLDANAQEIARYRAQVRDLQQRTNYASVSVTLVEKKGGDHKGGAAGGGTDAALDDSLGLLVGSFNWLLRALGVLIPAAILGGGAWWLGRTLLRRRREAVLF